MADRFARANGNFNDAIWAATAGGVAGSASVPTVGDNAIANSFTINLTGNVTCDGLFVSNRGGATSTGGFMLLDNTVLNCSVSGITASFPTVGGGGGDTTVPTTNAVYFNGTGQATIITSVINSSTEQTGSNNGVVANTGNGTLNVVCTSLQESSTVGGGIYRVYNPCLSNSGIMNLTIPSIQMLNATDGRVRLILNQIGVLNIVSGSISGPLNQVNGYSIYNNAGGVTITGNLFGNTGPAIQGVNATFTNINGSCAASNTAAAINTTGSNIRISGNILNAPNGTAAIYAPSYRIDPVPTNGYIRYARNGTGVGSDAWLFQYTTDSLSAFSMPPVSSVRFGTTFANGTLTGTCVIPNPASVTLGVPVDNTVGTAITDPLVFFSYPLSAINTPDTLGDKIKRATTFETAGQLIASFSV